MKHQLKAIALTAALTSTVVLANSQPNIIVMITDDMSYAGYSYTGNENITTEAVDQLISEGVFVEQAYATHHVCAPSRAGLMTGRYQSRFSYETLTGNDKEAVELDYGVDTKEIFMSEVLQGHGYTTAAFGKWHLGVNDKFQPNNRGFDYFMGFPGGTSYSNWNRMVESGEPMQGSGYTTDALGIRAAQFIEENKDRPFFIYFAPLNVHTPYEVAAHYLPKGVTKNKVRKPPRNATAEQIEEAQVIYDAMIMGFDAQVGLISDTLKRLNLDDNTIVVLTNDNGGTRLHPNGMFTGGKATLNEGGVRMPFVIKWPARLEAGSVYSDGIVSNLDIFPTAVAAAGASMPDDRDYDGVNIVPFLTGKKAGSPHDVLFWRTGNGHAMRWDNYKLLWDNDKRKSNRAFREIHGRRMRKQDQPLFDKQYYLEPRLYDLSTDVAEQNNIADQMPELVETMLNLNSSVERQPTALI